MAQSQYCQSLKKSKEAPPEEAAVSKPSALKTTGNAFQMENAMIHFHETKEGDQGKTDNLPMQSHSIFNAMTNTLQHQGSLKFVSKASEPMPWLPFSRTAWTYGSKATGQDRETQDHQEEQESDEEDIQSQLSRNRMMIRTSMDDSDALQDDNCFSYVGDDLNIG
jgi:hypothetical protein